MDLDALVSDAQARVAAAAGSAALEEVRIDVLGRKAPLVLALRELGSLRPGRAPRPRRRAEPGPADAGGAGREPRPRVGRGRARGAAALGPARRDPARGRPPRGHAHLIEQTRRDILDVFVGFGYRIVDGPEIDTVHYNFDALNHAPTHPSRQVTDTFYIVPGRRPAHPHVAGADPDDGGAAAAGLHGHRGPLLPPRHAGRDPHRHVHADRGARRRPRHHARAISRARCSGSRARSSAPSARCACGRTSSRSPSRRSRST